jgi:hypothetical protein
MRVSINKRKKIILIGHAHKICDLFILPVHNAFAVKEAKRARSYDPDLPYWGRKKENDLRTAVICCKMYTFEHGELVFLEVLTQYYGFQKKKKIIYNETEFFFDAQLFLTCSPFRS